jgi:hypothetical protein
MQMFPTRQATTCSHIPTINCEKRNTRTQQEVRSSSCQIVDHLYKVQMEPMIQPMGHQSSVEVQNVLKAFRQNLELCAMDRTAR